MNPSPVMIPTRPAPFMSPFLLVFWILLMSMSWLLPVHVPPWTTFPIDTWCAGLLLCTALVLGFRTRAPLTWHGLPCLALLLVLVPWVQYFSGLLPFMGQAWISSVYLLGFLLALLAGARWEQVTPGQLMRGLFAAIGLAAILSVGLQLNSWLGLSNDSVLGMWASGDVRVRPGANLGQPNQLATLLLWGVAAVLWAYVRRVIRGKVATAAVAFLLLGVALTQSRGGLLGLAVMLAAIWYWRALWPSRWLPRIASALFVYVLALPSLLQRLSEALLLGQGEILLRVAQQGELRLRAWRLFLQAIIEQPWFGYGWTEVSPAQLAVAQGFPSLNGIFQLSHNLFIDLALWAGLPIGLFVMVALLRWFWQRFRQIRRPDDAALFLLLIAVGVHAMVEFPLHYAYFLLPVGLVMGVLNSRLAVRALGTTPWWVLPGACVVAAVAIGVTARDYARVEASYTLLRLEQSILGQNRPAFGGPPQVWVLTQMREWIVVARYRSRPGMTAQELNHMAMFARSYPSVVLLYHVAVAMTLNGRPDEARVWLAKLCKITTATQCQERQVLWAGDPRLTAVSWPAQNVDGTAPTPQPAVSTKPAESDR